jgi:hypothetical protein
VEDDGHGDDRRGALQRMRIIDVVFAGTWLVTVASM